MLLLTREHFKRGDKEYSVALEHSSNLGTDHTARSPYTGCSQFLPTTQKIIQFSSGLSPKPTDKYVHEVVIGAPYSVTAELMDHFKVQVVCHGATTISRDSDGSDPYQILDSGNTMTTEDIVQRIIRHRLEFEVRNRRKEQNEIAVMKAIQKEHLKQNG
ncbi:hypothetical protein MSG28_005111, partial [Choristoneura fumiferana]